MADMFDFASDFNFKTPIGNASGDDSLLVAGGIGAVLLGIGAFFFGKKSAAVTQKDLEKFEAKIKKDLAGGDPKAESGSTQTPEEEKSEQVQKAETGEGHVQESVDSAAEQSTQVNEQPKQEASPANAQPAA